MERRQARQPSWESYILDEVIPQIQERYPIRPERRWHALAGVSMGGLGTAYLGSRVPGFFGSIAVFSGFVDTQIIPGIGAFQSAISHAEAGVAPSDPFDVTGPPGGFYDNGHNPAKLAANLAHTRVFMTTGDGTPLVQDPAGTFVGLGIVGQSEELGDHPPDVRQLRGRPARRPRRPHLRLAPRKPRLEQLPRRVPGRGLLGSVQAGGRATVEVDERHRRHARHACGTSAIDSMLRPIAWFASAAAATRWRSARRAPPVTITTDGGCVRHVATPAAIDLRRVACHDASVAGGP